MAEYFSHDYDAREDEKIQELLFSLKMEGYGIYWSIIEMLYKNDGYLQLNYDRIAYALHSHNDTVKAVINDFDLFKLHGDNFTSTSVLHRIKLRKGKSATARKAAKIRWGKEKANDADALQMQSGSNAKKKSKVKKSKVKESKVEYPWTEDEFFQIWEFWKKYKSQQHNFTYKEIGEQGALSKLHELSGGELGKAMLIIKQSIQNGWKGFFELKGNLKTQEYDREKIFADLREESDN